MAGAQRLETHKLTDARVGPQAYPLSIIIPVYNEGANFPSLWDNLSSQIASDFAAFVVYDFDEDDTLPVVRGIISKGEKRIRLVKNAIRLVSSELFRRDFARSSMALFLWSWQTFPTIFDKLIPCLRFIGVATSWLWVADI